MRSPGSSCPGRPRRVPRVRVAVSSIPSCLSSSRGRRQLAAPLVAARRDVESAALCLPTRATRRAQPKPSAAPGREELSQQTLGRGRGEFDLAAEAEQDHLAGIVLVDAVELGERRAPGVDDVLAASEIRARCGCSRSRRSRSRSVKSRLPLLRAKSVFVCQSGEGIGTSSSVLDVERVRRSCRRARSGAARAWSGSRRP